jgi:anthranilate synthase component 1
VTTFATPHEQFEQFQRFAAEGSNPSRCVREVLSDLDTPLSVYLKLADGPHTYLFESVEGGERFGPLFDHRPAGAARVRLRRPYAVRDRGRRADRKPRRRGSLRRSRTPARRAQRAEDPGPARVHRRLVGWFGFECIQYIEPRLAGAQPDGTHKPDELGTPDILLMQSDELAVFDNLKGRLYLIVHADPREPRALARANRRLDELVHRLRQGGPGYPETLEGRVLDESDFVSGFTREGFIAAVEKSKDYIRAGDIFQVVLSQRLSVPFQARPVDVYRALRALNPSPYMYFLDVGGTQVVGSSPEILVRLEDGRVTVRPIAGTRPRGVTPEEDAALEAELLADPEGARRAPDADRPRAATMSVACPSPARWRWASSSSSSATATSCTSSAKSPAR